MPESWSRDGTTLLFALGPSQAIRKVTVSVGIVRMLPGEEFKDAFARVDTMLYSAKERGRNRIEVDPSPILFPTQFQEPSTVSL